MPTTRRSHRRNLRTWFASPRPVPLFRDDFIAAVSAPISSPRTCDGGPGVIAITGTDQSISGRRFVSPNNASTQGWVRTDAALTKADGLALVFRNVRRTGAIGSSGNFGFRQAATLGVSSGGGINFHATGLRSQINGGVGLLTGALTQDTDYDFAIVSRAQGVYLLYKLSSDLNWTLLFVDDTLTGASLYPVMQLTSTPSQHGQVRAVRLSPLLRMFYSASGSIGTVSLLTSDFVAKMRCVGTATQSLKYRVQDADNYWRIERTATQIQAIQKIAGVDQAAVSPLSLTGGAATGDRIMVACDGTSHRFWRQTAAGTTVDTPTAFTSSGFQTATGIAVTDEANYAELEVFNRVQTLAGLAA